MSKIYELTIPPGCRPGDEIEAWLREGNSRKVFRVAVSPCNNQRVDFCFMRSTSQQCPKDAWPGMRIRVSIDANGTEGAFHVPGGNDGYGQNDGDLVDGVVAMATGGVASVLRILTLGASDELLSVAPPWPTGGEAVKGVEEEEAVKEAVTTERALEGGDSTRPAAGPEGAGLGAPLGAGSPGGGDFETLGECQGAESPLGLFAPRSLSAQLRLVEPPADE